MSPADLAAVLVPTLVALAAIAAAFALQRWCLGGGRLGPVAAVLAGALVGLAAGPSIAGRVAPERWEGLVHGGADERAILRSRQSGAAADGLVAATRPVAAPDDADGDAATHLVAAPDDGSDDEHAAAIVRATADWHDAVRAHQSPRRGLVGLLALALAVLAGRAASAGRLRAAPLLAVNLAVFFVLVPGGLGLLVLDWRAGASSAVAAGAAIAPAAEAARTLAPTGVAAAFALAAAVLVVGPGAADEREAADRAFAGGADLLAAGSTIVTVLAGAAVLVVAATALDGSPRDRLLVALPAALLAAARWMPAPHGSAPSAGASDDRAHHPPGPTGTAAGVLVAPLVALAFLGLDVLAAFDVWLVLGLVLLAGDGRWLASILALRLPSGGGPAPDDDGDLERRFLERATTALRTMRFAVPAMAAGRPMLALAAPMIATGVLAPEVSVATLLAIVVVEATSGARRSALERIEETERELRGEPPAD